VGSDFDPFLDRAQFWALQEVDPVIERRVGVRLANNDEVKALPQGAPAKGLVGVNVIAQQDGSQWSILRGIVVQPALAGGDLAVLLGVAVLGNDELRAQGDGVLVAGSDDDGRHRTMVIGLFSAFVFQARAVGTVDFLRRVVPGAVQRQEQLVVESAPAFQMPRLIEALEGAVIYCARS
jgi:hypothetical protein